MSLYLYCLTLHKDITKTWYLNISCISSEIYEILIFSLCSRAMTGIVCWRIWSGSLFRSELFGAQRGATRARRRTSDESLADLNLYPRNVSFLDLCGLTCTIVYCRWVHVVLFYVITKCLIEFCSCNLKSEQVTRRNKLQQKHLPMPTLVNCSPARDWVISIHFKFHRLRDVRSFVDKCLTGTPGTPLKVFSWIIPVYIRKCLLVSLPPRSPIRWFLFIEAFVQGVVNFFWAESLNM